MDFRTNVLCPLILDSSLPKMNAWYIAASLSLLYWPQPQHHFHFSNLEVLIAMKLITTWNYSNWSDVEKGKVVKIMMMTIMKGWWWWVLRADTSFKCAPGTVEQVRMDKLYMIDCKSSSCDEIAKVNFHTFVPISQHIIDGMKPIGKKKGIFELISFFEKSSLINSLQRTGI